MGDPVMCKKCNRVIPDVKVDGCYTKHGWNGLCRTCYPRVCRAAGLIWSHWHGDWVDAREVNHFPSRRAFNALSKAARDLRMPR